MRDSIFTNRGTAETSLARPSDRRRGLCAARECPARGGRVAQLGELGALSVGRDGQYRRLRGTVPLHEALRFQPGMRFHDFRDRLASFTRHAGQ